MAVSEAARRRPSVAAGSLPRPRVSRAAHLATKDRLAGLQAAAILRPGFIYSFRFRVSRVLVNK